MEARQPHILLVVTAILATMTLAGAALLAVVRYIPVADPAISEYSNRAISYNDIYTIYYKSEINPIPANREHRWTLHLEKKGAGLALDQARIFVAGRSAEGYPLPARPAVSTELGNGNYLVDKMMFDRPGNWVVYFYITFGADTDTVEVPVTVR